jgi:adenylyltransferase/sulfurtransferase
MAINWKRYERQIILPNFGLVQQEKLAKAKILVVGAGGLGCPTLLYLAAAGIGQIGIIDFDTVAESNLHRQILYTSKDIGSNKAIVAGEKITMAYPDCLVKTYAEKLDEKNASLIFTNYDLILDGCDNFETRYLIDEVCKQQNIPWIYASVSRFEGQVSVFNLPDANGIKAYYTNLFADKPSNESLLNCAEAGVLGVLPGIIGNMQALEAIKVLSQIGQPLANILLTFNGLNNQIYTTQIV